MAITDIQKPTTAARSRLLSLRVGGAAKTELDQVVSGLPWQDTFTDGAGIDAITGCTMGSALKPFEPKERTVKSSSEHYRFIQEDSELIREIETAASGKYNVEGVSVSASASYLSKIKFSELNITLIAEYESTYDGYDEATEYELTDKAQKLLTDPVKFRQAYGDYFISGGRRSSRFTAVYVCKASTSSSMSEFKVSFGGSAPDIFSVEGSARFMESTKNNKISYSIDVFMEGYEGTPPGAPWTPEKILEALKWFKENEVGIDLRAKLKHYSTIEPEYPRTVDVDPDAFIDLRQLYTKIWCIRSRYTSLPVYYQDQLKQKYIDVDSGVEAHQNTLPVDANQRHEYQGKADELLSMLNDISARMDFYYKVLELVSTEPGNGQEITETATGQQIWLYGFSTYSKSQAVTIQKWESRYHEDWQIGFREHTFEFGPDGNYLLVGWQLVSNWGDGMNGTWMKTIDRILLTNHAAVHVKSQYDRGCDWSVSFYFVDAKDYQFSS